MIDCAGYPPDSARFVATRTNSTAVITADSRPAIVTMGTPAIFPDTILGEAASSSGRRYGLSLTKWSRTQIGEQDVQPKLLG
jgi:hypothetical protein